MVAVLGDMHFLDFMPDDCRPTDQSLAGHWQCLIGNSISLAMACQVGGAAALRPLLARKEAAILETLPNNDVGQAKVPPQPARADAWVYGDFAPDPDSHDLVGLKARWIVDRLPTKVAPAVLDYGSGEGKHLHLVRQARPQARLVGVDVRDMHGSVDFEFHRVPDGESLPFADETFDVIVSCDVLEHVQDMARSLDDIRRVLRSGGAFIGFVPMEGGPGPHAFFRLFDRHIYRDTKDHHHAYCRADLEASFASRFKVVSLNYSYHLIGSTLDAAFFAGFKAPVLGPKLEAFWRGQENVFYRGDAASGKPSVWARLAQIANRAAYWESRWLARFPYGCIGLHFHLERS